MANRFGGAFLYGVGLCNNLVASHARAREVVFELPEPENDVIIVQDS